MRAVDTAHEILQGDPGNSYALLILVRSLQRAGRTDRRSPPSGSPRHTAPTSAAPAGAAETG